MDLLNQFLLGTSILLLLSIVASKATGKFGIPTLLIFLFIGMLAGSDGIGGIYFDNSQITQNVGIVALIYILFSGGLDTHWSKVKPVFWQGFSLATLGVLITAIAVGLFVYQFLNFSLFEGLLIGSIVASTDAAAVFSIMRSQKVNLQGQIRETIELESGSNDPMSVFLTIALLRLVKNPDSSLVDLFLLFFQQMLIGGISGYILGKFSIFIVNKIKLQYDGLYPVLTISLALFSYSITSYIGGNGFLAVYLTGLFLSDKDFIHKKSLIRLHDGLSWLMQIIMFLLLGLLVFPKQLVSVIGMGLILSIVLIFLARPLSVYISLIFSKLNYKQKGIISWVGLRGSVPIILATFPKEAGIEKADLIFNLVFFIVITSILFQGTLLPKVANLLNVLDKEDTKRIQIPSIHLDDIGKTDNDLVTITLGKDSTLIGKQIVEAGLPEGALIVLLTRGEEYLVPRGSTQLLENDTILILASRRLLPTISQIFKT
ncbi:MAG TPA: potassium/proton antiporter [Leptospiraceae bacterium]|nr:potassium/proton antiporter [Leptospiraceae bacterium]HMW07641.1 potassium/proton antiporter [Leptospiraceae bacterium]HMX33991.1 potassium/proton antiporter [Leptospiraceae bacterium]HMY33240.1 potassium/proton antiporter [Leptospiraceae bacterium]HMZ65746.1 potassium/proton antiporter [Leptospiraceae bacterium]